MAYSAPKLGLVLTLGGKEIRMRWKESGKKHSAEWSGRTIQL